MRLAKVWSSEGVRMNKDKRFSIRLTLKQTSNGLSLKLGLGFFD